MLLQASGCLNVVHLWDKPKVPCFGAGLLSTARAVLLSLVVTALHSLCSVQLLVMMANLCPNQDLAFVLAVSYTTLSVLLSGYFVRLGNVVSNSARPGCMFGMLDRVGARND